MIWRVIEQRTEIIRVRVAYSPVSLLFTAAALQLSLYTATSSGLRRHYRGSRREWSKSKVARRIRRLEKTVETLSHGLVLALTELNAGGVHAGRPSSSTVDGGESDFVVDTVDGLSTAFAGMGAREDCADSLL